MMFKPDLLNCKTETPYLYSGQDTFQGHKIHRDSNPPAQKLLVLLSHSEMCAHFRVYFPLDLLVGWFLHAELIVHPTDRSGEPCLSRAEQFKYEVGGSHDGIDLVYKASTLSMKIFFVFFPAFESLSHSRARRTKGRDRQGLRQRT